MIQLPDVHSLSDFQRRTKEHIQRLKETGKPEVLTVNGQAELVVQSADGYQELLDVADLADSVRVLRDRLRATGRDKKGVPADQILAEMRATLGLTEKR